MTKIVKKKRGRPLQFPDKTIIRMPAGWLKRINAALKADEGQGDFMRAAVASLLARRRS